MAIDQQDTIAAVATPLGEGAIAIIRLSGRDAVAIADRVFHGSKSLAETRSHSLARGRIRSMDGATIDDVLVGVMRGPRSYTGEDIVEVNCHGGMIVVETVYRLLISAGARPAEPGEFTKRAFLNGRLDLAQAEAVIDVVRAKSPKGLEVAAKQLEGELSARIQSVRSEILNLLAHLQVVIDYPEEGVVELDPHEVRARIEKALRDVERLLEGAQAGRVYRDGIRTAIVGRPNVGKSSILNALLGEDRAIVTEIAGTTRDTIEERAVFSGIPFVLTDTAGLRETDDPVERIGVERTKVAVKGADLIIVVLDGSEPLTAEDIEVLRIVGEEPAHKIVAVNKSDQPMRLSLEALAPWIGNEETIKVSALSREGIEELAARAAEAVTGNAMGSQDAVLVTKERHRAALERASHALTDALGTLDAGYTADVLGVDLQDALESLGQITGESVGDEVVAEIFAQFCVGK